MPTNVRSDKYLYFSQIHFIIRHKMHVQKKQYRREPQILSRRQDLRLHVSRLRLTPHFSSFPSAVMSAFLTSPFLFFPNPLTFSSMLLATLRAITTVPAEVCFWEPPFACFILKIPFSRPLKV